MTITYDPFVAFLIACIACCMAMAWIKRITS